MTDDTLLLKREYATRVLGISFLFLAITLPFTLYRITVTGPVIGNFTHLASTILLGILYFFRTRIDSDRLFLITMVIFMVLFPPAFIDLGLLSANLLAIPAIPILLRIGKGRRAAWFGLAYLVLVVGVFGVLFCTHRLTLHFDVMAYLHSPVVWLFNIACITAATVLFFYIYAPAEMEIMEKQAWFSAIFDGVSDAIIIRDAKTAALLDINKRITDLFGYTREEFVSMPVGFLGADESPEGRERVIRHFQENLKTGYTCFDCWPVRRKDGSILYVEGELRLLRIGETDVIITALRDITTRRKAEEALRESENKYRQVFEMESDALFLIEKETGQILEVNSAACSLYGFTREELLRKRNVDLSSEPEKTTHQTKTEGTVIPVRYHRKADGTVFPVEITAGHFTFGDRRVHLAAIRDISGRLKLEEQLQQAKKMESIGRLAGGVSHDFNNILSPILGFSELMLKSDRVDAHHREWIKSIRKAAERARDLTRQLLAFSRKQVLQLKPVSLETVLKEVEQILRRTIREDIHIDISIQPRVGIVRADVGQIEQILMNLALNAQDAMPNGGTLRLRLAELMFRPVGPEAPADAVATPHVMLSISDTGCGMEPEVMQHLFEPFFTTKAKGKGTGLGLSMVYGIIRQHGGYIQAESVPGNGTTFIIHLPVIADVVEHMTETQDITERIENGSETIMVVEDDEMVRSMTREILERHGYKVLTAGSGVECLERLGRSPEPFDMLLTDVIMPGMNGRELYNKLCEGISPLKVMFISGYDPNVIAKHGVLDEHLHFLQKPFTPDQLCAKVRETLVS